VTFLAWTAFLNGVVCGALAFFVLQARPHTPLARAYGFFNLSIVLWSASYAIWQCMARPTAAFKVLQWTFFFGMWPNVAFVYFAFCFEGMTRKRWRWLISDILLKIGFTGMNFSGVLFSSVVPRAATGLWGLPKPWLGIYLLYWYVECLCAFVVLIKAASRRDASSLNRMYYAMAALVIGHLGAISNWPMWYGISFPPQLNILVSVCSCILAYAIARYRVIDVQIVVRKTVVYSVVSAALAALYVGTIAIFTHFLDRLYVNASVVSSAIATIFIALIFQPFRSSLQYWMDRRFPRESLNQSLLREATSSFAHEIKRPLAKMSLPAQLALSDIDRWVSEQHVSAELVGPLREHLAFILRESHEAAEKIEAIRELSMDARLLREPLNLAEILEHVLAAEGERLKRETIKLQTTIASNLPSYSGNAHQLEIAFCNIIRNAVESMWTITHARLLSCDLQHNPAGFELTIKDSGSGIAAKDISHLFDPWFSTKGSHGMGIGLYLTQQIIQRHGGTIEVSSQQNKGSVFRIVLPSSPC